LACIFVLRSHGHHLRGDECACQRGPPDRERAAEPLLVAAACTPRRRGGRAKGPGKGPAANLPAVPGPARSGSLGLGWRGRRWGTVLAVADAGHLGGGPAVTGRCWRSAMPAARSWIVAFAVKQRRRAGRGVVRLARTAPQ
jgi:hypothetical protein